MRKIKITKLSDDKFNGKHPNGIYEGHETVGLEFAAPKVGERYNVQGLSTSLVTEIVDENTFKTLNSTYKIEVVE